MNITLCTSEEALNENIKWADIYFTPQYGKLTEYSDNGIWECCICKDNEDNILIIYVYLKRKINDKYYDLISPYGYSGIWISDRANNYHINIFQKDFKYIASYKNYVCEFIRFSPYLMINNKLDRLNMNISTNKKTYGIDLTIYDYNKCKKSHKYAVKKAIRDGYVFKIEKLNDISDFKELYRETMDNCCASPYYYFNDKYFDELRNLDTYIAYANAIDTDKNKIIGSSIFFKYNDMIHYHLSARKIGWSNVSDFILYHTIKWSIDNNMIFMHLGGSIRDNDSLSKFKKAISNTSYDYYCGRNILKSDIYDELVKKANISNESDYFPLYRAKSMKNKVQ